MVRTHHHVRLEDIGALDPDLRIEAVRSDDQVRVGEFLVAVDLALEDQFHTQLQAAVLKDVEYLLEADADEAVAVWGSHCCMASIVASENTIPQPNAS